MRSAAALGIFLLGAALVGALVLGDLRAHPGQDAVLFAVALAAWGLVWRAAAAGAPGLRRLLLFGLLGVRALALVGGPTLSDDAFRYVHEGRAQRLGLAVPYSTPPSEIVPPPDDGTTARVNHKDVPAAYPPGVELVLLATTALGDAVGHPLFPLRLFLSLADAAVVLILWRRRSAAFAIYGAHPLPLLEVALGAHLDGLGVCALFAALSVSRPLLRGALLGLGAHVKPVALLGLLASTRKDLARTAAGCAVALAAPVVPYAIVKAPLFRGLLEYGTRWRAAPFVYALLEAPLRPLFDARAARGIYTHLDAWFLPRPVLVDAGLVARLAAGALLCVALVVIARARATPEAKVGAALCALFLLAPTVHPWYLVWIVPFAALSSSRALLFFTAAAPVLYQPVFAYARDAGWHEDVWPRLLMVAALAAGALVDARRRLEP